MRERWYRFVKIIAFIILCISIIICIVYVHERPSRIEKHRREKYLNDFIAKKTMPCNIYPDITDPQEAVNFLSKFILGNNYYIVDPMGDLQANTFIVVDIAKKILRG